MKGYKSVALIFALKREYRGFTDLLKDNLTDIETKPFYVSKSVHNGFDLTFAVSGLGKVKAASCTQYLIDKYKPDLVLNVGSSGGVCGSIKPKDIIFVATAIEYDFKSIREKTPILGVDEDLLFAARDAEIPLGVLGSADQNADSDEKKDYLHSLGITIADWEGAAVIKTARLNGVKAGAIKVVTDTSNSDFAKEFSENVFSFNKSLSGVVFRFLNSLNRM